MSAPSLESFAPRHILVIDDDPMIVEILCSHYSELGFRVEAAADGGEGLRAIELRKPDIVLCDRVMPGLTGAELLEVIRQRGGDWQTMVFVFLTALTDRRDHFAMMSLHPDGYLHKPIDFEKADQVLAAILSEKQAQGQAAS